jgi:hypothetical protein
VDDLPNLPLGSPQPPVGNCAVGLDRTSAQRTEAAVKWAEGIYLNRPRLPEGGGGSPTWNLMVYTGSGGVAAASSAGTPSSATATICTFHVTSWVAGSQTITIHNMSLGGAVTGSAYVVVSWVGGIWVVTMDPC